MEEDKECCWFCLKGIDGKLLWAIIAVLVVIIVLILNTVFYVEEKSAPFGDAFGVVNALFSGLAFVGLIYAILLQSEELSLQRQELKETRGEFEKQNETMKKQRFDNTFFNMLNLHNEVVGSLSHGDSHKGRKVFSFIFEQIRTGWMNRGNPGQKLKTIEDICEVRYGRWHALMGHYFRYLYRIIKFVDDSSLEEGDKQEYVKILRAQLSNYELVILLYNSAYHREGKSFQDYIERYALLDNLPRELIIDEEHMKAFSEKAYGGNY